MVVVVSRKSNRRVCWIWANRRIAIGTEALEAREYRETRAKAYEFTQYVDPPQSILSNIMLRYSNLHFNMKSDGQSRTNHQIRICGIPTSQFQLSNLPSQTCRTLVRKIVKLVELELVGKRVWCLKAPDISKRCSALIGRTRVQSLPCPATLIRSKFERSNKFWRW